MSDPVSDDDDTVLIRPRRRGRFAAAAAAGAVLLLAAGLAWMLRPAPPAPAPVPPAAPTPAAPTPAAPTPAAPPPVAPTPAPVSPAPAPPPPAAVAPQAAPAPKPAPTPAPEPARPAPTPTPPPAPREPEPIRIRAATSEAILADIPEATTVYRLQADGRVLVLDFATLREQALMLNRMAMFVERRDAPRDQVLSDGRLAAALRASGSDADTFYYGHDYRAADMARFFATAETDGLDLTPQENWLHTLLRQEHMDAPGAVGCLISIPRVGARSGIDAHARATILRHELSHAAYFTSAPFATFVRQFWNETLSDEERARMRGFLGNEGYDTANEDLMMNEAQAYLVFTRDPRFFTAAMASLTSERLAALRAAFESSMPKMWLQGEVPR